MDFQDIQNQNAMVLPNTNPLPDNGMNGRVNLAQSDSAGGQAAVPGFTYDVFTVCSEPAVRSYKPN